MMRLSFLLSLLLTPTTTRSVLASLDLRWTIFSQITIGRNVIATQLVPVMPSFLSRSAIECASACLNSYCTSYEYDSHSQLCSLTRLEGSLTSLTNDTATNIAKIYIRGERPPGSEGMKNIKRREREIFLVTL